MSKATNKDSQIDFYRNALGQLVREHQHYKVPHFTPLTAVLRYEYDVLGNLAQTIRPDGQVQSNLSYGSGHIYGIALNKKDMVAFQRDDLHRETARMLANGLVQSKNYNDVGLLSSQLIQPEQETLGRVQHQAERQYHYDQNYLLTQVDDSRLGKLNYQYDAVGRLIQSQSVHKTESFAFAPAGNLIDPIATQASQVKSNLIAQYKGKNYKYDAQGNVIESSHAGKTLKLTWDNLNRLIRSDHNGQVTEYGYDVFGRRLYKKNQNAQTLTLFGWDGDLMIWESQQSHDVEENYTKHYVYEPQSFVPLLQTGYTGFIKLLETPDYAQFQHEDYLVYKDPIWKTETRKNKAELERVLFYHCDQVGTPQTLSNELGECIWEIKQDVWGGALEIKASHNLLEQTNIRFQGQYYDGETGLHYNRYRYYEPHSARYVSKDPIGLLGGMNNSKYVRNPNQWVDRMGLKKENSLGKAVVEFTGGCYVKDKSFIDQTFDNYTDTMGFQLTDIPAVSYLRDKINGNKYTAATVNTALQLNPLDAPWLISAGLGGLFGKAITKETGLQTWTTGSAMLEQYKKSTAVIKSNKYGPYTGKQVIVGKVSGGAVTGLLIGGMYSSGVLGGSAVKAGINKALGDSCE